MPGRKLLSAIAVIAGIVAAAMTCAQPADDRGALALLMVDDPFAMSPPATALDVDELVADGGVATLVHGVSIADATIALGNYSEATQAAFRVTAFDADGGTVAWGETLPVELGALAGQTLDIFVQRTGALSRMPAQLSSARAAPLAGMLSERYVFVTGGVDALDGSAALGATADIYDLVTFSTASNPPVYSSAPLSLALYGLTALAIGENGASWLDLSSSDAGTATLPAGNATWADIAAGTTVYAVDGTGYVVGATRSTGATAAILVVSTGGTLSLASLDVPRTGAAAAWVSGRGLLVMGGTAADGTVAGVELLGPGAALAQRLSFAADGATGAGAAALDGSRVVLVGGTLNGTASENARLIDLTCVQSCAPTAWAPPLGVPLATAQAFALDADEVFVVGDDAAGATHTFLLRATSTTEIPLRLPRRHARGVRLPTGPIAVVGGNAQMESFVRSTP